MTPVGSDPIVFDDKPGHEHLTRLRALGLSPRQIASVEAVLPTCRNELTPRPTSTALRETFEGLQGAINQAARQLERLQAGATEEADLLLDLVLRSGMRPTETSTDPERSLRTCSAGCCG